MLKTFALMLIFSDGYLGGTTNVGSFHDHAACDKKGGQLVMQYASYGHPASYACAQLSYPKKLDKNTAPTVMQYTVPMTVMP